MKNTNTAQKYARASRSPSVRAGRGGGTTAAGRNTAHGAANTQITPKYRYTGPVWLCGFTNRWTFSRHTIASPSVAPVCQTDSTNGSRYAATASGAASSVHRLNNQRFPRTTPASRPCQPGPASASPIQVPWAASTTPGKTNPSSPLVSEVAAISSHSPTTHGAAGLSRFTAYR